MDRSARNVSDVPRLERQDLLRSWLRWLFFSHSAYNYERLQGLGFAHSMVPIIRALYTKKEEIAAALKRHLVFFNTEPQVGAVVHGVVIAMEEQRAGGEDVSDEAINSIKSGLMGPLAGLGDSITQGLITPILLALGISLAIEGNLAGPILYFLLESGAIIAMSYGFWMQGYRWGKAAVERLLAGGLMHRLTDAASVLGMMVIGSLAAKQVSLSIVASISVGQEVVHLQGDVLDPIMKGLLPLLLTLVIWWLLSQGRSPLMIIGLLFVLGIDGVLLDWLGWAPSTVTWQSVVGLVLTVALWWSLLSDTPHRTEAKLGLSAILVVVNGLFLLWWGRVTVSVIVGVLILALSLAKRYRARATATL